MVDERQLEQDLKYIALGKKEGAQARCRAGIVFPEKTQGFYLEPALFIDTTPTMTINREEIFGPVASVIRVKDYDEALAVANDTPFGLSSGIATTSLKYAEHFKRNSAAGMVMVNLPTAGVDYHVPFGGRKGSSYGPREQGRYAAEFYTTVKTAYVNPVMDLSLQVGKYDIQKALGKGATGTVYLAKDTFTGKEVALKTIEPEVFRDPEFGTVYRSQFLNEASLAGKLRHPHIVSILDAVVGEDSGHIAMELVTGGDLSQHAKPGTLLPVPDVLQIAFKCCGALDYAAKEGIVHRDIKPANIMIAGGTEVKIADFGAAVLKKSQVVQTAALGSPYYMSPEQIAGQDAHLPQRHVLARRGALRAADRHAAVPRRQHRRADRQDPARPTRCRRASCARTCRRRSIAWCCARSRRTRCSATRPGPSSRVELSKVGELVLPAGAIPDSEKYVTLKKVADARAARRLGAVGARARRQVDAASPRASRWCRKSRRASSFFFLAKGEAKVIKNKKLLNMVNGGECFGEMAYIGGGEQPRHATVEAMSELLLAEFEPAALEKMSLGAQLHLTRALVRNVTDRLALANVRLAR